MADKTDAQIVAEANSLCRHMAQAEHWYVPVGHKFHEDDSPRAASIWARAKVSFEVLLNTDIDDAVSGLDGRPEEHEFAFDLVLKGSIRVKATTEEMARKILDECFDAASLSVMSGGRLPPTFEASLAERPSLYEIDGEEV